MLSAFVAAAAVAAATAPAPRARAAVAPRACAAPPRPRAAARHYVNLTNGLEALPALAALVPPGELRFTRMQSSHAEASAYDKLLSELDHDLLWSLSAGHACYLYDFAARNPKRGVPRAHFLGAEFVKWALAYLWFGRDSPLVPASVQVRGKNVVRFWRDDVLPRRIAKDTKRRLRYYSPFAAAAGLRRIDLRAVYGRASAIDGQKDAHVAIARAWLDAAAGADSGAGADIGAGAERMDEWMREWRLALFDADTDADELRRVQAWMQRGGAPQ